MKENTTEHPWKAIANREDSLHFTSTSPFKAIVRRLILAGHNHILRASQENRSAIIAWSSRWATVDLAAYSKRMTKSSGAMWR